MVYSHLSHQTSFESFLAPISPEAFFAEYWEKKPLLIQRHDPTYYQFLFSRNELEHILAFARLQPGELELNRNSQPLSGNILNADGTANLSQVYKAYEQGYTIVLNHLSMFHEPSTLLYQQLEAVFNHPVGINTYLTPQGTQGFNAHFDTMDNFLLQIEGRKHWRVYGEHIRYPIEGYGVQPTEDQLPKLLIDVVLEPGDLLYFPRGFIHQGLTMDEFSLHITVGVEGYTWLELISQSLASALDKDERFRRFLPIGLLTRSPAPDDEHIFRELLQKMTEQLTMDHGLDALAGLLIRQPRRLSNASLAATSQADEITEGTLFSKRPGVIYRYIFRGGQAILQFSGGNLRGSAKAASALRFIADVQHPFGAKDVPGMLMRGEKLMLLEKLVHEQVLILDT